MDSKAYIAVAVVAILIVGGAAAFLVMSSNNDKGTQDNGQNNQPSTPSTPSNPNTPEVQKISKKMYPIDPTKGWSSWNPILTNTSSSNMTGSAYVLQVADYWYNTIYGEKMDYSKYSLSDVPKSFLAYESLVSYDSQGRLVVSSTLEDTSKVYTHKSVTFDVLPDYIICAASFASTVYTIMATAAGTDYKDYDDSVVSAFYDKIYAGDSGLATKFTVQYGVPSDKWHGVKMGSCTSILKYKDQYMTVLGDIKDEGKTVCFLGMASVGSEADQWLSEQMGTFNSRDVLFNVADLPAILAGIEAISHILGYGDQAQSIVDKIRLNLWAISQEAEKKESAYDYVRSVCYVNVGEIKVRGAKTIAQELIDLFHMQNCVTHDGNKEVQEEVILAAQPDIIVYVSEYHPSDTENFDLKQALRIKDA
ncbi:MAG: hypothetical protein IJ856_02130 [Candidatus Methanomethylophilaceae archaeon]|nr:hypothetical protein [Candidatus Methanomethylophilaceae archaeon]